MPDVFIPWDSTLISDYYSKLVSKGILSNFILSYIDGKRKDLNERYPDVDNFIKDFSFDESLKDELDEYAKKEGLTKASEENPKSMEFQKQQTKALIARNLYGVSAYFQVINQVDVECHKALEIIDNDILFRKLTVN